MAKRKPKPKAGTAAEPQWRILTPTETREQRHAWNRVGPAAGVDWYWDRINKVLDAVDDACLDIVQAPPPASNKKADQHAHRIRREAAFGCLEQEQVLRRGLKRYSLKDSNVAAIVYLALRAGSYFQLIADAPNLPLAGLRKQLAKDAGQVRSNKSQERRNWFRSKYGVILATDPANPKKAQRKTLDEFKEAYPGEKPPKPSTIKRWISTPRKRAAKTK